MFKSHVTGTRFIFDDIGTFSCKSSFLIYLITCSDCGIQYVGQTIQHLHERLNGHRSSVKKSTNTFIYQHYSEGGHDFCKAKIQIIDILDPQIYSRYDLDQLERFWINTLCTVFPLGLNDKIQGVGNISSNKYNSHYECYYNKPVARYKRGHGKKRKLKNKINKLVYNVDSIQEIVNELLYLFKNNSQQLYIKLKSFNKNKIKIAISHMLNVNSTLYNIICSFYNNRYTVRQETSTNNDREFITVPFSCKFIDKLSLNSIFRDSSIESLLPKIFADKIPLIVYYKYNAAIGRKLLNYSQFLKNLTKEQIKHIIEADCTCSSSPFNYEPHNHVITGDLNIIPNLELRKIMSLGTKYREPTYLKPENIKTSLFEYIDKFVKFKSQSLGIDAKEFDNWANRVKEIISNRIQFYISHNPQVFIGKESIFKNKEVKDCVYDIHKKFILVVADKTSNNYVIICKKFYLLTLIEELGIDKETFICSGNTTYRNADITPKEIIDKHTKEMKNIFKITIGEKDQIIPKMFWNAKLHKVPFKARFIAGARRSTTKKLAIRINNGLKVLKQSFVKYCEAIRRHTGINYHWSISSSEEFVEKLKDIDIWSMEVFDFTTLYTKLDLQEVINSLYGIINLLFSPTNKYICIGYKKSFFSKKKYRGYHCFDNVTFKEAICFIVSNTFVSFGGIVLQQIKGIPMGGSCSSLIADLSLNFKEFSFMKNLVKERKLGLARLLSSSSRYVDDINIINYNKFRYLVPQIYPVGLEVERNGVNNKVVCYLDIKVIITEKGIRTEVYNKVDDFDFPVVTFTFASGNMPLHIGYNIFFGQILRYSRICSHKEDFMNKTSSLYKTLVNHGYDERKLVRFFRKIFSKDPFILFKYGYNNISEALVYFQTICTNHLRINELQ